MLETSARLLRLLSLLQARPDWPGPELARRLGVSTRTVRTDVERLRALGYPVTATPGVAGGYRLGAGSALPPLLLDDEEAIAVAVALRTAAGGAVTGVEETSLRALTKLLHLMPSRLRHRMDTVLAAIVHIPRVGPTVDAGVLTEVAAAIRGRERLRFDYRDHSGHATARVVEPDRLVHRSGRWYLVAWDVERDDWRTFRADRLTPRTPTGPRFTPRPSPEGDVARYLERGIDTATWRFRARVRVHASAAAMRDRLPAAITVQADGPDRCIAEVGSDSAAALTHYLGLLDTDFEVLDSPELAEHLRRVAERFRRAAGFASGAG
ncbi:helix-turn-helix transcriptional regulator [Nocardia sp. NPDC003482]